MKKIISLITAALMLCSIFTLCVSAEEKMSFDYQLSVDGKDVKYVSEGDVITVVLYLQRTDSESPYMMYAMQSEIRYDDDFFDVVEGSFLLGKGVDTNADDDRTGDGIPDGPIRVETHHREVYLTYPPMSGGANWNAKTLIGSFQLKVVAKSGATIITNEDAKVSLRDGSGSHNSTVNSLKIIVTEECTVSFNTNDGSSVESITVPMGEKIPHHIEHPEKEGYYFGGWYLDVNLTIPWDFKDGKVEQNITLYAKWSKTEVTDLPCDDVEYPAESTTDEGGKDDGLPWGWIYLILGLILVFMIIFLIILLIKREKKDKEQ